MSSSRSTSQASSRSILLVVWALAWAIVLLIGTLGPSPDVGPPIFPFADKLLHFLGWLLLTIPLGLLARRGPDRVVAGLAAVAFGLLVEVGQLFVPGRSFELWDLFADAVGVVFALLATLDFDTSHRD